MAWTYTGDPQDSEKDAVRFLIGDTNKDDQLLKDAEIEYLLQRHNGNVNLAAGKAARGLAAMFTRDADKSVGDLRISSSQRASQYEDLAKRLEREAYIRATPFAGGISHSQKEKEQHREDRVKPSFKRGQFDKPGADTEIHVESITRRGRR